MTFLGMVSDLDNWVIGYIMVVFNVVFGLSVGHIFVLLCKSLNIGIGVLVGLFVGFVVVVL